MGNSLKWFMKQPKEKILCYKKIIGVVQNPDGTETIRTEWRQCQKDLDLGSLKSPNKDILEFAYFTKERIRNIQKEE